MWEFGLMLSRQRPNHLAESARCGRSQTVARARAPGVRKLEGPMAQICRYLAPNIMPIMALGTLHSRIWVLGPAGKAGSLNQDRVVGL